MTGPLYTLTQWCLRSLPVDGAGRRVFDETLADWRKEAANATGRRQALVISVRAGLSVVRCVMLICRREIGSREGIASLLRLAAWSTATVLLFVAFNWNRSIPVAGLQVVIGPTAVWLGSVSWALALMPLLAFVSTATGRRTASMAPRLGPALVAGLVMFGAMGWAMPAANQAWRELVFGLSGGTGPVPPGINERSLVELIGLLSSADSSRALSGLNLRLLFIVAVPVLLVLGLTARSLTGRWRLAATVLPLVVFAIPFLARIDTVYGHASSWVAVLAAVLVTRTLARRAERDGKESAGSAVV
jgi:hypothetical protein